MNDLEFNSVFMENMGALEAGTLRLTDTSLGFRNGKTSKTTNVSSSEIRDVKWQMLGNKPGLRVGFRDGSAHRFGGFKETDLNDLSNFARDKWCQNITSRDLMIEGWNYGEAAVKGKSIEFSNDGKHMYEIPCNYVSNCIANKNEAILEFHNNNKCPVALTELRFHMPADAEEDDTNKVEEFKNAVLAYAGLEMETEQPIATLDDILCTTPRGRYEIKIYPNSIALHGKTYDYKIPVKSIDRLFLVPHRDGLRVYLVVSLNPPIRQTQTRYHFLVFEFRKDEMEDVKLGLTEEQIKDNYKDLLQTTMHGAVYETMSILFKAVCNLKITVPGKFVGCTGTPAIQCTHKQNPGLLYPMEKGFLFIHKPPMYMRFEEISSCHFARSHGGTVMRTIDFEIDLKNGVSHMFTSIDKEENNKLYDYLNQKNIKIRNAQKMVAVDADSDDDDDDPYAAKMKAEGRSKAMSDSESDDEDYDLDKDLRKKAKEKDSSEGSGSEPDDEYDSGSEQDSSGTAETEPDDEDVPRKKKRSVEKPVKKDNKEKPEKKGKKAKKDPNEPKRAMTAYFLWFNANRASLKVDGDSIGDVAKKGGAAWKEMSSDDKKEWEEKAAEDKVRYETQMKEYKKNGGAAASSSSQPTKKATGPSPSKAKSKEYVSDSDDSDEDATPKKKNKKSAPADSDDSDAGSDGSDDSD